MHGAEIKLPFSILILAVHLGVTFYVPPKFMAGPVFRFFAAYGTGKKKKGKNFMAGPVSRFFAAYGIPVNNVEH